MKWSYYLGKDKMYDTRLSNDLYLRFSVNHCPLNPDSVHMIPENGMKIIGFHDPDNFHDQQFCRFFLIVPKVYKITLLWGKKPTHILMCRAIGRSNLIKLVLKSAQFAENFGE